FNPPKSDGDVVAIVGLYALFGALSAPLLWESLRFALVVSDEGLDCRSPWRGQRFHYWDEVRDVSYRQVGPWVLIRFTDGWKFRISNLVPGLSMFLGECEDHLPPEALEGARQGYALVGRTFPGDRGPRGDWRPRRRPERYR